MMKSGPLEAGDQAYNSNDAIPTLGVKRGVSALDLILRIISVIGTLASAIAMGTTDETLPITSQFFQFKAEFDDLPSFTFFVIANSIVCSYLALTIPISVFHIIWTGAKTSRIILVVFDAIMMTLLTAGASAATAIVYLAHQGNAKANWFAICQQFDSFCERISGSLIGSFGAVVLFILIIITSAIAISRH